MRRMVAVAVSLAMLLTSAPAQATTYFNGRSGSPDALLKMVTSLVRSFGGLAREVAKGQPPPKINGPDPIFGLVEAPSRLLRYARQGYAREVLEGLRRGKYLELPGIGEQYAELRLQVREMLLAEKEALPARSLQTLMDDSQTPAELAKVLNYILSRQLQWRDYSTNRILQWGQGRLRYLTKQQQPAKEKPQHRDPPPPPAPASAPQKPVPPKPPTPKVNQLGRLSLIAGLGAGLAAAARFLTSLPPPPIFP